MATATQTPQTPAAASNMPEYVIEREDLVIGNRVKKDKDKDGKDITTKSPDLVSQEDADKLTAEGKFEGFNVVTVSVKYPKTLEALTKLYEGSEGGNDELVANHNRGAKTKVGNRIRAKLLVQDDEGNFTYDGKEEKDGILDLTGEITSGSRRKFLSEEEKVFRSIDAMPIPDEQKKAMIAIYQSQKKAA